MNFEDRLHPDFVPDISSLPALEFLPEIIPDLQQLTREHFLEAGMPQDDKISVYNRNIPGRNGAPDVRVRIYEPKEKTGLIPAVEWMHGGAFVIGLPEMNDDVCIRIAKEINCIVISPDYRLAPQNPYPCALNDCYTTLLWLANNSEELKVDTSRIAVAGVSAGGGLAAAVCLLARDKNDLKIKFQMPLYPMIDDRFITQSSSEIQDERVWNTANNVSSWNMYLGGKKDDVSQYAAPARATDLSGLPPAYTCVGDLEPFRDETIEYVSKLTKAGVPVEFHLNPGCFHGCELIITDAEISKRIVTEYVQALKRSL